MHTTVKRTNHWDLRWLLRPERPRTLEATDASTRALHETRRSLLRKLSLHFARERWAQS